MEVFFQILSALVASMAIVDCENLNLRPLVFCDFRLLAERLNYVENNCYSIFICLSDKPNMSVCRKRPNNSELFIGCLGVLKIREERTCSYLQVVILIVRNVYLGCFKVLLHVMILVAAWWFCLLEASIFLNGLLVFGRVIFIVRYICVALLRLVMNWIDMVHVASLRLVDSFVWTLLVSHVVLFVIHILLRNTSLSRSWSFFWLLHRFLLRENLRIHLANTPIDVSSMGCLLHHCIS